jgi:hypothetical protein
MERDRKITSQGSGKDENRVDNIMPDAGAAALPQDAANAGVSPDQQGADGNEVTADIPVDRGDINDDNKSKTDRLHNNNTTNDYLNEVDVNMGGVPLEQSPGATNEGNNPSNPETAAARMNTDNDRTDDREAVARMVDEDAEKQTGRPTGAIYGTGGDIISVQDPASNPDNG